MFITTSKELATDVLQGIFNPFGITNRFLPGCTDFLKNKDDIKQTMYHEAGHALANHLLNTNSEITKIFCKSSGSNAGKCSYDLNLQTSEHVKAHIVHLMAGSAAEKVLMGKDCKPSGLRDDIDQAKFY